MCIVLVVLQARRYPQSVEVRGRLYNRGRLFPEQKRLLWRRLKEQLSGREWKWSLPMTEIDVWTRSGLENTRKDSARWRQQYAFFQMRGEVITRLITEYDFLVCPLTTSWLASQMRVSSGSPFLENEKQWCSIQANWDLIVWSKLLEWNRSQRIGWNSCSIGGHGDCDWEAAKQGSNKTTEGQKAGRSLRQQ